MIAIAHLNQKVTLHKFKIGYSRQQDFILRLRKMMIDLAPAPSLSNQAGEQEEARALREVLANINERSCPNSYNFHMHTQFSDGKLRPEEIIDQAIAIGLQGLAITDHHSVGGYKTAQNCLNHPNLNPKPSLHLWSGVEINAYLLKTEVHILGYAFDPDHRALEPYLQGHAVEGNAYQASAVIDTIHKAGGLAVLAHPARYRYPATELIPEAVYLGIDGVETYYAYNNPTPWTPSPKQTKQVRELGELYNLLHTCGTDTHGRNIQKRL
nr:PHP domain-containing protein [Roseofilum sp. Belize Diploria]